MYKLKDERFDLFAQKIFRFHISPKYKERITQIQEFKDTFSLKIYVISHEDLVLLKSLTDRENDFEDILTILENTNDFDWKYVIETAKKQEDNWVVLDLEQTLQKLKIHVEIPREYFDLLYK
ncbi:MAG: DUF6036 family nucleotidyltransferase [Candidatus Woesearchaeota archaeon]